MAQLTREQKQLQKLNNTVHALRIAHKALVDLQSQGDYTDFRFNGLLEALEILGAGVEQDGIECNLTITPDEVDTYLDFCDAISLAAEE